MFTELTAHCQKFEGEFSIISETRKQLLEKISVAIAENVKVNKHINLVYICTHNSRRSHFGQIWGKVAAEFYQINGVSTYSCGTEATAFHPNAIQALRKQGFVVEQLEKSSNSTYAVHYGENQRLLCYSKVFDDPSLPTNNFIAIMTCSDAEENCPFVPGTLYRFSTTYEDPKIADGTELQEERYKERADQIALESLYLFSNVKNHLNSNA